jgi:hypothetical protein
VSRRTRAAPGSGVRPRSRMVAGRATTRAPHTKVRSWSHTLTPRRSQPSRIRPQQRKSARQRRQAIPSNRNHPRNRVRRVRRRRTIVGRRPPLIAPRRRLHATSPRAAIGAGQIQLPALRPETARSDEHPDQIGPDETMRVRVLVKEAAHRTAITIGWVGSWGEGLELNDSRVAANGRSASCPMSIRGPGSDDYRLAPARRAGLCDQ